MQNRCHLTHGEVLQLKESILYKLWFHLSHIFKKNLESGMKLLYKTTIDANEK
jgi:hypothetical protein